MLPTFGWIFATTLWNTKNCDPARTLMHRLASTHAIPTQLIAGSTFRAKEFEYPGHTRRTSIRSFETKCIELFMKRYLQSSDDALRNL
jgi:hypothetical protein